MFGVWVKFKKTVRKAARFLMESDEQRFYTGDGWVAPVDTENK